ASNSGAPLPPRIIQFEGRTIQVPGDATDDEVRQILTTSPAAQSAQPPIQIGAPDGSIVQFPAGTSDDEITTVMRRYYGGPGTAPTEKLPKGGATTFEVVMPDGSSVQVDAPDAQAAARAGRLYWQKHPASSGGPTATGMRTTGRPSQMVEFEGQRYEFPADAT